MIQRTSVGQIRSLRYAVGLVAGICIMSGTSASGSENPDLCLKVVECDAPAPAVEGCGFAEGDPIHVNVEMGLSTVPVCAGQFFLEYDTNAFVFLGITPGGGVFNTVLFEAFDRSEGTIDYLVGADPGAICSGTNGPATLATISFIALDDCENQGVDFRPHDPPTRLGAANGAQVCPAGHLGPDGHCGVLIDPCGTGEVSIEKDGIVNLLDYAAFYECASGARTSCCLVFDSNHDGALDLLDWGAFQRTFQQQKLKPKR